MTHHDGSTPGLEQVSASLPGNHETRSSSSVGLLAPRLPDTRSADVAVESSEPREEPLLISRLRRQGVPVGAGDQLKRQEWDLAPELVTYLRDSSNWLRELMKASSSIQPGGDGGPTRLLLDGIEADSILWELGLQEGDVILLIDGEIPQFSPIRALDYICKADAVLANLDRGEGISVTVLRQNHPVHLVYQSWSQ